MPKAVLVMDMPEQICQKCTLCYETENGDEYMCCATGKFVLDGEKPDWCPLRELPEKATDMTDADDLGVDYVRGTMDGWNACLDEILKECDADATH